MCQSALGRSIRPVAEPGTCIVQELLASCTCLTASLGMQALWMQAKEAPKQAALRALARHNLPQDEVFADCVVQLLHAKQTNMGMAVLGPAGCGKSTCTMIAKVHALVDIQLAASARLAA